MINDNMSFEDALERLKQIVATLEKGEAGLSDSMKLFEEGTALAALCSRKLDEAKQKVTLLTQGDNGPVQLAFASGEE